MQQRTKSSTGRILAQMIFLFTIVLSGVLFSASFVQAAVRVNWYNGENETEISVEAGSKFYIGDYIGIYSDTSSSTASLEKASYRTQDKKIASVNGKGYLAARKVGTTDITVVCQGKTLICHLTVEKKGTFDQTRSVKELKAAAKTLAKGMPKKLNASKGFKLYQKRSDYLEAYGGTASELSYDGFVYERNRPSRGEADYPRSSRLAVPEAGRYLTVDALLHQFMRANNPASKSSKKTMKVASASASSKSGKIIIKLTGKLGAEQILAAQLAFTRENSVAEGKSKANYTMTVYDETANRFYRGKTLLKKGSRQLEVKLTAANRSPSEEVKIEKGHVYMLGSQMDWANGTKVTAK